MSGPNDSYTFELVDRAPCGICAQEYQVGELDDGICLECSGLVDCAECAEGYRPDQLIGDICTRCFEISQGYRASSELESCTKCGETRLLMDGLCNDCMEQAIYSDPL